MLRKHHIDPLSLSTSQRILFECAGDEQRNRLIQIWQICPERSGYLGLGGVEGTGSANTDHRLGFTEDDRQSSSRRLDGDLDMEEPHPENNFHDERENQQYAEPYMASGYGGFVGQENYGEPLPKATLPDEPSTGSPYRISNDPIYQSKHWWKHAQPHRAFTVQEVLP